MYHLLCMLGFSCFRECLLLPSGHLLGKVDLLLLTFCLLLLPLWESVIVLCFVVR